MFLGSQRKRATLLCIDDHAELLAVLREFLEVCGYEVVAAPSGREGIVALSKHDVDGVIVDYDMPRMNGIEVAEKIRTAYPDLPILMLSGESTSLPKTAHGVVDRLVDKSTFPEKLLLEITALLDEFGGSIPVRKKPIQKVGHRKAISKRKA